MRRKCGTLRLRRKRGTAAEAAKKEEDERPCEGHFKKLFWLLLADYAAGRCDEHAPRDLARRPAGCSQKAPRLGSERKSSGSENKSFMTSP